MPEETTPNHVPLGPTSAPPTVPKKLQGILGLDAILGLHEQEGEEQEKEETLLPQEQLNLRHYQEGVQTMLDIIAPAAMEVRKKDIVLNDMYIRTFYVYNWPNFIFPNWIASFVNFDAKFDIAHFIYPADPKAISRVLRKKVTEIRSSIHMLEQRGIVRDPTLEAALQDAEELRDLLARGQEKLFQFGMYVTIYAESEQIMEKLQTDIESILGSKLILTKPAMLRMEHGWTSTLPLCLDELDISRNMNTSPLATSFPFSSSDLTEDKGVLYGINRHNDSLVIFDRFNLPNANANIFATSGAGKSFTAKMELLRYLMTGTDIIVIDPENEYTNLCAAVGGTFVPVSIQSQTHINPFDLPKAVRGEEASKGEILRTAIISLTGLFKLMLGTLTPTEEGILDKAIINTYALRGITMDNGWAADAQPPTLHDLVDVLLTTEGGESLARILQKYTTGSFSGLFDQPTNLQLDSHMVVFQIRDLEDQLRPMAMYIVLNFVWNSVRSAFKQRILVVDEAWNLMQYEDSARFLYSIIKRARKYFLGVTTITQDIDDFVESPYGRPIITNSALQILMKQSPASIDGLQKLFYLTDGEKYMLLNSDIGQGIIFAGYKHAAIQFVAGPDEAALITTKPQDIVAQRQAPSPESPQPSPEPPSS